MLNLETIRRALRRPLAEARPLNPHLADMTPGQSEAAAVLVPLVDRPGGIEVLLTRRPENLRRHAGQISFPGGRADPGDRDAAATALRETFEEIGIPSGHVEIIGTLPDHQTRTGFNVTPVVGVIRPPLVFRPNPTEVAEIIEAPLDLLFRPDNGLVEALTVGVFTGQSYIFRHGEAEIWGATAAILATLRKALQAVDDGPCTA